MALQPVTLNPRHKKKTVEESLMALEPFNPMKLTQRLYTATKPRKIPSHPSSHRSNNTVSAFPEG
jgi:hypothetical protein